jgi:hypothetical protein
MIAIPAHISISILPYIIKLMHRIHQSKRIGLKPLKKNIRYAEQYSYHRSSDNVAVVIAVHFNGH